MHFRDKILEQASQPPMRLLLDRICFGIIILLIDIFSLLGYIFKQLKILCPVH